MSETGTHEVPALSVVVPSVNGLSDLLGCLDALAGEHARIPLDVLVVDRVGDAVRAETRRRHPWVRVLEAPPSTTIPDLRRRAFDCARAPLVAVIEDHVQVPPGWASQMLDAHTHDTQVVGGAIENAATDRIVDWAAFLCEYSHLLPPLAAGPAASIAGNNVTYRRDLLDRFRDATGAGRWEDHLHRVLREHGVTLHCRPEIVVAHKKHYTMHEYVTQRYLYARSYAGARVQGWSWLARIGYAAAAGTLLPALLLVRIVGRVWSRPRFRSVLTRSLPLLALFVAAWAAGEVVGAAAGPGDALSRVC